MVAAQINPVAIYDDVALAELLAVNRSRITRAANAGKLRFVERLGKRFFRGDWVIEYLGMTDSAGDMQAQEAAQ